MNKNKMCEDMEIGFSSLKREPVVVAKALVEPPIEYQVYIDGEITGTEDYFHIINTLRSALEGDVIHISINSPGGLLNTAQVLCKEIYNSTAFVYCSVYGECSSAATAIAFACDDWDISPNAQFLIHNASYGAGGNGAAVKAHVDFSHELLTRFVEEHYTGILTEDEMKDLLNDKELYFFGGEILARLQARKKQDQGEEKECSGEESCCECSNSGICVD